MGLITGALLDARGLETPLLRDMELWGCTHIAPTDLIAGNANLVFEPLSCNEEWGLDAELELYLSERCPMNSHAPELHESITDILAVDRCG